MRRRTLIAIASCALILPAAAAAQADRGHRVGILLLNDCFTSACPNSFGVLGLESELRKLGYREGGNLIIERRHASGNPLRLKDAASDLVKRNVEAILTFGAQAVTAASQATRVVPIVGYTNDHVALGVAASYARPGGNVTGVSPSTSNVTIKQLEILPELVPGARRIAWLRNPANPFFSAKFGEEVEKSGAALGVTVTRFDIGSADALEPAVREIARLGFDAVLVPGDLAFLLHRARLSALLLRHRLPGASTERVMLDAGLLVTYGIATLDGIRRMASQTQKILRGAAPGEIPIEFINRFELGINVRTAKALGLAVPQSILLRADRVIE